MNSEPDPRREQSGQGAALEEGLALPKSRCVDLDTLSQLLHVTKGSDAQVLVRNPLNGLPWLTPELAQFSSGVNCAGSCKLFAGE